MSASTQALRPHFKVGHKAVYLPNFVVTLLRTPELPPTFAKFQVPLNLNKLDIRDYLFNAYGVRVLSVRSWIKQQPVQQDRPDAIRPRQRRWFRPKSIKYMTVEMDKAFVWPEEPKDFKTWDKETFDAANRTQDSEQRDRTPEARIKWPRDMDSIAVHAKRLLKGEEKWKEPREDRL